MRNSVLKRRRRRAQAIESSPSAESLEDVVEVESDTPRKAARVVVVVRGYAVIASQPSSAALRGFSNPRTSSQDSGDEGDGEEPTQRQATQRSPSRVRGAMSCATGALVYRGRSNKLVLRA